MSKIHQSEVGNLDCYIQICAESMRETEARFSGFINLLENVKSDPVLIFTDFFSKLDNPLYTIANFSSNVLAEAMLPEMRKIEVFKGVILKEEGYNAFTVQDQEEHHLLTVNLKGMYFLVCIHRPTPTKPVEKSNPHVIWLCQIVDSLYQFYAHPSIKNWRRVVRLDETKYPRKLYLIYFLKKGRRAKLFLERAIKEIKTNNENAEYAKSYAAKEAHVYEKNKEKVEKITLFLRKIGYRDINDDVQIDT